MRKVNVLEFVSLDGVIQAPGGPEEDTSGGFAHWVQRYGRHRNEFYSPRKDVEKIPAIFSARVIKGRSEGRAPAHPKKNQKGLEGAQ